MLIVFVISNVKHTTRTVRNTVLTFWEVITLNLLEETLRGGNTTLICGSKLKKKDILKKKQNKTKQIRIQLIVTPYFEMT